MRHTPGPWKIKRWKQSTVQHFTILNEPGFASQEERDANINLIVDASTVSTECGLTPRQLLEIAKAAKEFHTAIGQRDFFGDGYRNGSASISEYNAASDELEKASTKLFELFKQGTI